MDKVFEKIKDDKLRIGLLGLKRLFEANAKKMTKDEIMAFDFTFMNITNALTELQAIKEAKPSEALRQLGDISYFIMEAYSDHEPLEDNQKESKQCFMNYCSNIKATLLKAEKLEKAWEVVKKKNVDFEYLSECDNVKVYNAHWCYENFYLTQEEFDLLRSLL